MTDEENVYKTIQERSKFIIDRGDEWTKEISSAKNYIATPDLKNWTFGKSAGLDNTYHSNGGTAKKWLYSIGFIDILKLPDSKFKKTVLKSFETWTTRVKTFDILDKFNKDQINNQRFEILVHNSLLPKTLLNKTNTKESNQFFFDEGFKKVIVREITVRSRKVVSDAKIKHGVICAVCEFDFAKTYGAHGFGFIEMHHLNPVKDGQRKTNVSDLQPVCPNCHRMLHKGDRLLSIDELKKIIKNQKRNSST
ncbi:HNH endonuclease [Pedobacter sp. Leaf250]|uniref:HNH endonuclease n=1 Tax=Pedobacter sp. Leaf250 TaxID=2876559 RepID=UPI001E5C6EE1|nr:HNH endonuclease [Pedobacter sp. Leaf250]